MKIGLLTGMEDTFPRALQECLEGYEIPELVVERVKLGGTRHDSICDYDVILDRVSHEVQYYRAFLRQARLSGTRIVNDPFLSTSDDRFFDGAFAARLGINVPRTVVLPQKDYPDTVTAASLGNLVYPVPWEEHFEYVGSPCVLRPIGLKGWRHVARVHSLDELLAAYDRTGSTVMMLQEQISWSHYVRCIVVGKDRVITARFDPEYRQYLQDPDYLDAALEERIVREAASIAQGLGYDLCAIEFAVRDDDEPFAVEFVNPVPDFERAMLTPYWFEKVVQTVASYCVELARAGKDSVSLPSLQSGSLVATVSPLSGPAESPSAPAKKARKARAKSEASASSSTPKSKDRPRSSKAVSKRRSASNAPSAKSEESEAGSPNSAKSPSRSSGSGDEERKSARRKPPSRNTKRSPRRRRGSS